MRKGLYTFKKSRRAGETGSPTGCPADPALNPAEVRLYEWIWASIAAGHEEADRALWTVDYVAPPPSMEQFLEADYFLGQVLRPAPDNTGLWPTWKAILCRDFDFDSRLHNVVLTGSLGVGNLTDRSRLETLHGAA